MIRVKRKKIIVALSYLLYALIIAITVCEAAAAISASVSGRQNALFGYSLNVLQRDEPDINLAAGDGAVTCFARAADISSGDVVAYYTSEGIAFGIVSGVEIRAGEYIFTVSNTQVAYSDIAGKYIQTSQGMTDFLRWTIGNNAWIFWLSLTAAIPLIALLMRLSRYLSKRAMAKKILNNKIGLFEQQCFQKEVFSVFCEKEKKLLYPKCRGAELVFDMLSRGKPSKNNPDAIVGSLVGKRCTLKDATALLYSREPLSQIDTEQYIADLPKEKRAYSRYETAEDIYTKRHNANILIWGFAIGLVVFFGFVFGFQLAIGRFQTLSLFQQILLAAAPYLLVTVAAIRWAIVMGKDERVEQYFQNNAVFPQRYEVFANGAYMTTEQILRALDEIEASTKDFAGDPYVASEYVSDENTDKSQNNDSQPTQADGIRVVSVATAGEDEEVKAFAVKKKPTYIEQLAVLSEQKKLYYDELKQFAMQYANVKFLVSSTGERIKIGTKQFVQFVFRRGELVASFAYTPEAVRKLSKEQKSVVKPKPTFIRIVDESSVDAVKKMMVWVEQQLKKEEEERRIANKKKKPTVK